MKLKNRFTAVVVSILCVAVSGIPAYGASPGKWDDALKASLQDMAGAAGDAKEAGTAGQDAAGTSAEPGDAGQDAAGTSAEPGDAAQDSEVQQLLEEGIAYYYGLEPQGYDLSLARECLEGAAARGSAKALYYLGLLLYASSAEEDRQQALEYFTQAEEAGFALGTLGRSILLLSDAMNGGPVLLEEATGLAEQVYDEGYPEAGAVLGEVYLLGMGTGQDIPRAIAYLEEAAESGDLYFRGSAMATLGSYYQYGLGGEAPDYEQAAFWYQKAAEEGYPQGYSCMGGLYADSGWEKADMEESAAWYQGAIDRGIISALYTLGSRYEYGSGGEPDYEKALEYYRQGAQLGDPSCMYGLGHLYAEGKGTEKDFAAARMWLERCKEASPSWESSVNYQLEQMEKEEAAAAEETKAAEPEQPETPAGTTGREQIPEDEGYTALENLWIPADAASFQGHYYECYSDLSGLDEEHIEIFFEDMAGHPVSIDSEEEQAFLSGAFKGAEGSICEWDSDTDFWGPFDGGSFDAESAELMEQGKAYFYGIGETQQDIAAAYGCFVEAMQHENPEGAFYAARLVCNYPELFDTSLEIAYLSSMTFYMGTLVYGSPLGWFGFGNLYRTGLGVKQDYEKARLFYQRAIDLGCVEANYGMGILYEGGCGVEQNMKKALQYLTKAAECEDFGWRNYARKEIGDIYYYGYGETEPDPQRSVAWYSQAAREGFSEVYNQLGTMYGTGSGVRKDSRTAAEWFEKSAQKGDADAMYMLGLMYAAGEGVAQNPEKARELFYQALEYAGDNEGLIQKIQAVLAKAGW